MLSITLAMMVFCITIDVYADNTVSNYNNTSGQFVTASVSQGIVDVDCGFMPDYIYVVLPFSSGNTYAVYDASISTTTSTWTIPMEQNTYTITLGSTTGETGICEVNSNGFKFRCNAGNTRNVTCTFFARSGERVELLNVYINPVGVFSDSYNTVSNYNNYYDGASGSNKTDIINTFSSNLNVNDLYNTINFNGTLATQYMFFDDLYSNFPYYNGDNINIYMALSYSDSENVFIVENICSSGNVWILGNHVYSDQQFWMSRTHYIPHSNNVGGQNILTFQYDHTEYVDGSSGYNGGIWTTTSGQITGVIFSDIPVYFIGNNNASSDHQDIQYLNNCIITNDSDNGFVVDRRLYQYVPDDPEDDNQILGVLSGSYKHLFTGISQDKCDLFISYELNDYTKSLKDRVKLVLDYEVNIEGSYSGNSIHFSNTFSNSTGNLDYYNVFNSNILQIDMDNVFSKIMSDPLSDSIPDSFIPAEYYGIQSAILYHSYSALNYFDFMLAQGGFGITQTFNHESNLIEDLFSGNYTIEGEIGNRNWVIPSQSTLGYVFGSSYDYYTTNNNAVLTTCNFVVTEYLLDSDGNSSSISTYMYDLITGNSQIVGGFETDGDTSFTKYTGQNYATNPVPYNSTAGGYSIVGGNPQAYGGSANASIGDININVGAGGTAGQILVDMPSDEWLQHSPNFNELITTIKTGLTGVGENSQSVTELLTETYTVFPVPVWSYLTIAIAAISALAVIRYIRRG